MSKNIYQKMHSVMQNIEYLKKNGKVEYGSTNYKAMTEEKVTMTVRKELISEGLVVYPIEQEVSKEGQITTTNTKYKMVNIDNPEEYVILASSGQGADSQDKGVGKAMTYSFKYMLLRTFAIPTGEDPDKIASEQIDDEQKIAKIKGIIAKSDNTDNPIDTVKFLLAIGHKFKKEYKSVDEMRGAELDYAIMRLEDR